MRTFSIEHGWVDSDTDEGKALIERQKAAAKHRVAASDIIEKAEREAAATIEEAKQKAAAATEKAKADLAAAQAAIDNAAAEKRLALTGPTPAQIAAADAKAKADADAAAKAKKP